MLEWSDVFEAEEKGERIKRGDMCAGIEVFRQNRSLILIPPDDGFKCISTGYCNGGFVESPTGIVNTTSEGGVLEMSTMGNSREYHDHCTRLYLNKLGLDPYRTVALGTAAHMDNAAFHTATTPGGVTVSVAMTGGIRGNGGRAGDPASFDEAEADREMHGTIVLMMAVDCNLSERAMIELMDVGTEAKSCVIQELQARSLYSHGIATGSGTDQVAVICRSRGEVIDGGTGKDGEIGTAAAECVRHALAETFDLQSYMVPETQCDPYVVLSRYGVTESRIRDEMRFPATMRDLLNARDRLKRDTYLAAVMSAALHVQDRVEHGMTDERDGLELVRTAVSAALPYVKGFSPVMDVRLDACETIPDYLSIVMALSLLNNAKLSEAGLI